MQLQIEIDDYECMQKIPGVDKRVRLSWKSWEGLQEKLYKERKYLIMKYGNYFCNRCGKDDELQFHHIDRNHKNNNIENIEVLCYKCHAKEHNRDEKFFKISTHKKNEYTNIEQIGGSYSGWS